MNRIVTSLLRTSRSIFYRFPRTLPPMSVTTRKMFSSTNNVKCAKRSNCSEHCNDCSKHTQCWNCHHFTDCHERFCPECHKIQPVYSIEEGGCNYFQLFGIPELYDVDYVILEKNYKNLQKVIHPDLYSTKSNEEKIVSANVSSILNIAHNKLKNPITRAAYLAKLLTGVEVLGEDSNYKIPMDMLMEVMEVRELLSSIKSKKEKQKLQTHVHQSFRAHEDAFRCSFCKKDKQQICNEAVMLKYYDNIIQELYEAENS